MVSITAARDPSEVRFAVIDMGVGVAPDDLPRLFERFYRADKSRSSGGTGCVLAIARHIVQSHGGLIGADSPVEGMGTTMWFTIPLAPDVAGASGEGELGTGNADLPPTRVGGTGEDRIPERGTDAPGPSRDVDAGLAATGPPARARRRGK